MSGALLAAAPPSLAAPAIASLQGFSSPGGALLASNSWTADPTPFMVWTPQPGPAIQSYSFAVDGDPDCLGETTEQSVQLGTLADGVHTFSVRAIDGSGSCGARATATFQIDATPDRIGGLFASTGFPGTPILSGVYQPDRDPRMSWTIEGALSPIYDFSYAIDAPADCGGDGLYGSFIQLGVLELGLHEFQVRARDAAGNCGPAASFILGIGDPLPVPVFPALEGDSRLSRPSPPSAR